MDTTERVTPEVVTAWARAALAEWLPGHTTPDKDGTQYRVSLVDEVDGADTFEVAVISQGHRHLDPRRFRVTVAVAPVGSSHVG